MSYNISVENLDAANNAASIIVTDTLPSGMAYISSSGSGWSCTSTGSPVSLTCTLAELTAQTSSVLTLNVKAPDSNVSGTVTFNNTATVVHPSDPDLTNNSSLVSVTLNRIPTAVDDTASTTSHTNVSGNVLTNDSDIDGDSLVILNTGSHTINYGAITIAADGSWTYTPGYFSGVTDSFTYTVSDGNGGTSTATLQINIGSACTNTGLIDNDRDFCLRKQTVVFGDMVTIGNTVVVAPNPQPSSPNQETYCSGYSEGSFFTDVVSGTDNQELYICSYKTDTYINETSAELITSAGSTIKWAGLYLQSVVRDSNTSDLINMDVKIKNGSDAYVDAGTPTVINHGDYQTTNGRDYDNYSAFIDVTNVLTSNGWRDGVYTVANVPVTTDSLYDTSEIGKYGAWSLIVIYEETSLPLKSISVYDGWKQITYSNSETITVDNFYTPTTGTIDSEVSIFTAEGDKYRTGDRFRVGTTDIGTADNAFDAGIQSTGTRTPSLVNNQGIDIKTYQIGTSGYNLLTNSQNSISFSLSTVSPYDYFYPAMLAFSTEVYHPRMCYFEEIHSSSGKLSTGDLIDKGSDIRARVLVRNDQNEPAENVLLYKSFNSELPYVTNSTLVNNTLTPDLNSSTFSVTDTLDGDIFDYSSAINLFSLHLGDGATSSVGGDFENNETALFDYNATANFDGNTSITYQVAYTMPTIGFRYDGELAKCEDFNNTFGTNPATPISIGNMDIIETSSYTASGNYSGADKNIFTKVVNKPFTLEPVYVDVSGNEQVYTGGNYGVNMAVLLYTSDTDTCSEERQLIWEGELATNTSHTTATIDGTGHSYLLSNAEKDQRIKASFIDYGTLIDAEGSLNCSSSSLTSSLCLVPACFNTITKIETVFPPSVYPHITICTNGDGGGGAAPCNSSMYEGNCGGLKNQNTITPAKYDNDIGCAMCIADALDMSGCSTDNFSARPEQLVFGSTHSDLPNLLRAAKDYNLSINAYSYGTTTNTPDYNLTNAHTIYDINVTTYDKNNEVNLTMAGDPSFDSVGFDMSEGQSIRSGVAGNEVAGITFNDIGKVNIQIKDKTWAAVDNDDTPEDCSADGTWICGDLNVTFIPDHFDINVTITNNDGNPGTITYLANEVDQMAARLHTGITARAADGNTTLNFAPFPMYENNITVIPVVIDNAYVYPDSNETNITDMAIGFELGVKTVPWSEDNTSQYLRFNFLRDVNQTSNPFNVNSSEVTISITSDYTDPDDGDTETIDNNGISAIEGNVTMLYGRTHASRQRYEDSSGTANIYYESYCFGTTNGNTCNKTLLPNGIDSNRTDDIRWYINSEHNINSDGNVSIVLEKDGTNINANDIVDATDNPTTNPSIINISYDETLGYPYKTTMENNASRWLIYNRDNPTATRNYFSVEFEEAVDEWCGESNTSSTTTTTGAARSNRRSMW